MPLVANQLLESATVGGSMRTGRATSTAGAAGSSLSTRVREAFMTTIGLNRFELNLDLVVGGADRGLGRLRRVAPDEGDDGRALRRGRRDRSSPPSWSCCASPAVSGFVSGMLTASPFAAVGICARLGPSGPPPVIVACASLPLVWAFQYSGGAGPQWGGRYTLLSGALLAIVAVVVLEGRRTALVAVLLVSALVTAFGLAWLSQRSTTVADGDARRSSPATTRP